MSISGESAAPAGTPPTSPTESPCGAADGLRPVTRRANSEEPSPHATIPLPSADTPTRERPPPTPAAAPGLMSIGAPIVVHVASCSRLTRTSVPPLPGAV